MGLDQEAIRGQVERLLQSKTFETSEAHRRLLQYLTEETLAGKADRLKEYTVGLDAFGKPASYDPRQDSIVRLQVGRLRQKLLAYYETEGNEDPVHIGLPKGGFKLSFEPGPRGRNGGTALSVHHRKIIASLAVALVLAIAWAAFSTVSLVGLRRQVAPAATRWSPELEKIWAPFIQSERPMLVCLGAPLFVRIPSLGFFRDPKANDWDEAMRSERMAAVRKILTDSQWLPSYNFTGVGEASGAFMLAQVLSPRKRDILLTRSNLLSWQEITDNDIVFLGPPKFNLQLQGAPLAQEIVIEPDGVRNLKPQKGEPEYLADRFLAGKQNDGETHAVISRMPGPSGVGEFMAISGNASADTLAAAQWLTQPWRAAELVKRLSGDSGNLPRYYQVVLKVAFKHGVPVQSSYAFHHVLQKTEVPQPRGK
jgi:hypothetical protein